MRQFGAFVVERPDITSASILCGPERRFVFASHVDRKSDLPKHTLDQPGSAAI
jgi:hypothetical protein